MLSTPNLALPLLAAAQAQKHVTHNEALMQLDALTQLSVVSRSLTVPPPSPAEGSRYIVADGASGGWASHSGDIAWRLDGVWSFLVPREGWLAWVEDEAVQVIRTAAGWAAAGMAETVPKLGINASADAANRLAVAAAGSLFSHAGNGHQLVINKSAAADTASLVFQTGYSGRAEIGLVGSDALALKVSDTGSAWTTALTVAAAGGVVGFAAIPTAPTASPGEASTRIATTEFVSAAVSAVAVPTYVANKSPANLAKFWQRMDAALRSSTPTNVRISMLGDSLTLGTGGVYGRNSVGAWLADRFRARGYPAVVSKFGLFSSAAATTTMWPGYTFTGTWGGWTDLPGGKTFRGTSAGATMTSNPGATHDTVDVYWYRNATAAGGGGTVDLSATDQAGTPVTISITGAGGSYAATQTLAMVGTAGLQKTTVSFAAPGVYKLTATVTATNAEVFGFEHYTASQSAVLIRVMGMSGYTSTMTNVASITNSLFAAALTSDLWMVNIGSNDTRGPTALATYTTNLTSILNAIAAQGTPSVLGWTWPAEATTGTALATQQQYIDAFKAALGSGRVLYDLYSDWQALGGQSALAATAGGLYADTIHPSALGNLDIADKLFRAVTRF